jgi:hypothetical protein
MKLASIFAQALVVASVGAAAFAILPACSSNDGEEACKRVESLCSSSSGGDGGTTSSVKVSCDGEKLNDADNASDVKDCVDKAADCNAAIQCLATAKL